MPLSLQYDPDEPNSAWNWLERWTASRFWEPLSQAKKVADSKSQANQGNLQTVETEPGRPKRSSRRVPAANVGNVSIHSTSESEKRRRNPSKVTSHPVDSVQEHLQNEPEKVKRSLRKVLNTVEATDRLEVEGEKPKRILRKASRSTAPGISDQGMSDSAEKTKNEKTMAVAKQPAIETFPKTSEADEPVDVLHEDHPALGLQPSGSSRNEENFSVTNGELSYKEDQASNENQKSSRRRASFPAKQEYPENGFQSTPTKPSYMAATESAKAKLRGQGSPRFGQDGDEKNGFTRRHSLPSSTNGKFSSQSPRAQRLVQASVKAGIRDRSLMSSRDGNDKVVQTEWRR